MSADAPLDSFQVDKPFNIKPHPPSGKSLDAVSLEILAAGSSLALAE